MFQKFYTDTLKGRYIKALLAQTPLPLFDCVVDGDHLIEGCYYVYKRYIIQCASSGILAVDKKEYLYPSDNLYPSNFLILQTGYIPAKFYVRSIVDDVTPKTHSTFKSSTNYYDSQTHYHLGRYLRYIYTTTGLNLFPFYNFYNETHFEDIQLEKGLRGKVNVSRVASTEYKVIGIPILFGHTYSIYIDCPTNVLVRACIHDSGGFIDNTTMSSVNDNDALNASGKILSHMMFSKPQDFRVETTSHKLMMHQHNLYLVIQLPKNNDSSIVVLENVDTNSRLYKDEETKRNATVINPSLLKMNTRECYAFSDRLFEYIVGNVVHSGDLVAQNIAKVQTAVSKIYPEYSKDFISGKKLKGVWDSDLSDLILDIVKKNCASNIIYDQDGNVNKDTELLIYSKGGNY